MSDPRARAGDNPQWVASPLLLKPQQTPRFLRAPWDQQRADAFGPWRLGQPVDPALPVHEMAPRAGLAHEGGGDAGAARADIAAPGLEGADADVIDVQARPLTDAALVASAAASAEALADAEARGHARGLEEGRAQALADIEAARAREAEMIRHLAIELRALSEDPDRFFEPLRRLALHIAEQLVRGELRASPDAVSQIVRQSLAALDPPPGSQVLVCVHPEDAAMLHSAEPSFLEGLKLQPDPQLHRGSVRLRLDDTVLEDLVEHRLQALVDRLLVHPGGSGAAAGMARESVLVRDFAADAASPLSARGAAGAAAGAGRRRGLDDVIDATARPVSASDAGGRAEALDPTGPAIPPEPAP